MSEVGAGLLGLVIGLVVGLVLGSAVVVVGVRRRSGPPAAPPVTEGEVDRADPVPLAPLREAVLERAPIAVLTLDSSDDLLLSNRRARELGLLGRRGVVEPLLEVGRAARQNGETTAALVLPTGGIPAGSRRVRAHAIPLPNRVVALLVEDVTEAYRVNAVRRDFVANVSHEIKTPVGAISLLAEAAVESLSELEDADQARHFVERIARESARLGRLVSELLDLSRLQGAEAPPELVPVRLDDVVSEAIDRTELSADAKDISIVRGEPSDAVVRGVETQLVTAVANLLDNAVNYSPEGTRVAVAIRRAEDVWQIIVTDQGLGIPEADLDRIFERFYRVDPARSRATGGTGLGLAIVKHIVRNHGGEVRVWSSPGAGSSFTLRLPVADGPALSASETPHARPNADTDDAPERAVSPRRRQHSSPSAGGRLPSGGGR
jgi:two-component system sensor histidine kinase SenX3